MAKDLKKRLEESLQMADTAIKQAIALFNECNEEGQVDFCTAPGIGVHVSNVYSHACTMDMLWHQEVRK
jgi:hypothetical protein